MGEDTPHPGVTSDQVGDLELFVFVGTRPEAVKLAPVVLAARAHEDLTVRLVNSGQHPKAMLEVLDHFGLGIDEDIDLFTDGQTLEAVTAAAVRGFAAELDARRPDIVIVQGDTTTAFAGALAAFDAHVPVAHVEAGLRTHNRLAPFPEEMNRRLIDTLSTVLFPPTRVAASNLAVEGLAGQNVFTTGNTSIDALRLVLAGGLPPLRGDAARFDDPRWRGRVVVTAHRRESWGAPMDQIAEALFRLGSRFSDHAFLVPLHPNPIVRRSFFERSLSPNVLVVDPLHYSEFVTALARADLVVTDSGGAVEEATALGRPTLILREHTERPEAVDAGAARMAGVSHERIEAAVAEALLQPEWVTARDVFGDGHASERIVGWLRWRFGLTLERPEPFAPERDLVRA